MTIKIDRKIVGYKVKDSASGTNSDSNADNTGAAGEKGKSADSATGSREESRTASVIQMHETLQRPEVLIGSTYKIKVPEHVSPHAMYITINDIVLNEGTEYESRRPFEVFINTKNLDHFQWIVALTVIMSAVFRKGGDITFLVDELRSVFDPRGGYWVKGAYKQSIIAEIGDVIERHLIKIGMLQSREMDESQKELIRQKREALEKREAQGLTTPTEPESGSVSSSSEVVNSVTDAGTEKSLSSATGVSGSRHDDGFPADATLCAKCSHRSCIVMDGCQTCLNCGDSKCG